MSDQVENFENILKKHSLKRFLPLYSVNKNKQQNKHTLRPQDVISSVSSQLKAIQVADLCKTRKSVSKDLVKYNKKCTYLTVNKLPVYEEPPKQSTKFDTQCVTDTQLINVIEDAEIEDVHRGMTQEFETSFDHLNTEKQTQCYTNTENDRKNDNCSHTCAKIDDTGQITGQISTNYDKCDEDIVNLDDNDTVIDVDDKETVDLSLKSNILKDTDSNISIRHVDSNTERDVIKRSEQNTQEEQFSQILRSKTLKPKNQNEKYNFTDTVNILDDNHVTTEDNTLILDQFIKVEDANLDRPPSPIFVNKNTKPKSNTPSPLVFALDKFENFENFAVSLLESNNFDTAKHVINSQILNKELCFKMNEDVELNTKDTSPVFERNIYKDVPLNIEQIEIDKGTKEILDQLTNQATNFEDEILFSSDEEDDYVHKEYQDLPFTCALETSFYNQSDVLDKTMYVGFQTASNRSIQVCTGSFVKAKSILIEVNNDDITVTELVKTCEKSNKDICDVQVKLDSNVDDVKRNFIVDTYKDIDTKDTVRQANLDSNVDALKPNFGVEDTCNIKIPRSKSGIGFTTANNKVIKLSEKALARCKKVFQDIDLNETFDSAEIPKDCDQNIELCGKENNTMSIQDSEMIKDCAQKIELCGENNKEHNANRIIEDDLQGIDDEIIQEFENIEMSLKEEESDKENAFFTTDKHIKITESAVEKMKNIFQGLDFDENVNESNNRIAEEILSQIISKTHSKKDNTKTIGFKTAGNKNIPISKQAWVKSKMLFENIDTIEFPNKIPKHLDEETSGVNINQSTRKTGFVTANNEINNTSETVSAKVKRLFKDINTTNEKVRKDNLVTLNKDETTDINEPSTSKCFVGFKTANSKNINISEKAWSKSRNIFNDIDSIEFPKKENKVYPKFDSILDSNKAQTRFVDFKNRIDSAELLKNDSEVNRKLESVLDDNKTSKHFVSFKTARNNNINISKEALAKTKNIFKDIDSPEFVYPNKIDAKEKSAKQNLNTGNVSTKSFKSKEIDISNINTPPNKDIFEDIALEGSEFSKEFLEEVKETTIINSPIAPAKQIFIGFKTANNKGIQISYEALAKSKNIFKDIDKTEFDFCPKTKKDYPELEVTHKFDELNPSPYRKLDIGTDIPKFEGFITASKKQVKISSEALIKTKNIFKDIEKNMVLDVKDKTRKQKDIYPSELITNEITELPTSPVFKGFQTANKKSVTVSAKALEISNMIFEEINLKDSQKNFVKSNFSGFQTASNKKVKISDKAFAKSRELFRDIDAKGDINNDRDRTESKTLYPKEIYQDNDLLKDEIKKTSHLFKGFSTAGNKPVAISKDSLEISKKLFQNNAVAGFKTGNNTIVKVSEKALTETRKLFDTDENESHSFRGFQTASNKNVKISEEALAKTKKIFQDIDNETHKKSKESRGHINIGFRTGNNKEISVSKEALARSKRLFSEVDAEEHIISKKKDRSEISSKVTEDIHAIIDTQVIKNFDESLHTEDFSTPNTNKSKRSGSPILSCPRAKKRKKFETPYNTKDISKPIANTTEQAINKNDIIFAKEYKKTKTYTLKDLSNMTKDMTVSVDPYLQNFNYDNLLQFEFNHDRNDLSYGNMTTDLLKEKFLNSVNRKLVPDGWLDNHLKLILWKLISYEIKFKSAVVCSARNVVDQLKYRYDRELYNAQRPALRKIFERDDVSSKIMVLCVVAIYADGARVASATNPQSTIELLLTDGWYCIRATVDAMLSRLVCNNKICVGTKIVTSGAEMSGAEQAVAPWEDTSSIRLKIFGNSTRRARWDARLGYLGNAAIMSQLSSVSTLGGKVSKLRVFITRVYPSLYVEKFEDGSTVTRSERLENIHQMKVEAERQVFMEKLYEEVEREFADRESQESDNLSDSFKRPMDSGSQIAKMMRRSKDPAEFKAQLSSSQSHLLETYSSNHRERLLQDIQTRVRDKVEKEGVCVNRNVVSLLKIRVVGMEDKGERVVVSKGMLSIWKPNDAIREIIKEGVWIDVLNVVPTAVRYSEIQISAGRQSVFSISKFKPPEKFKPYITLSQRQSYTIKDLAQNPTMSTDYNEIDTVGLIFLIDPPIDQFDSTRQSFQNVYLTDVDKNIICINFWGGLKKFGYQNVLDTGQLISCVNLQKRAGNTKKTIPQFRVTEFSYFTQTPKNLNARKLLDELNKKFLSLDRRKFCQDCILLKNNYSVIKQNNENISPYKFNNDFINISKNKMFIDSPLARSNKDDIFNLTGLDFESTFKQDTQLTEEVLKRKRKVNEKIAKLKMYGEPPPLSPLHIINRSKQASNSYKSPLLNNNSNITPLIENKKYSNDSSKRNVKNDSCDNIANVEISPEKCGECNSPVLNRTYVKSVNPVKINFDVNESNIDHFAEEFDGSPPLSLD